MAFSLSGVFSEEQCKICCDDARSVGFSVRHERCCEQSGDDGTEDQRVREVREHRNFGILEDWHRDSSSGGRIDVDASHHELAHWQHSGISRQNVERQASQECSDGKVGRRKWTWMISRREGSKRGDMSNKKEFNVKCYKCGNIGHMSKHCRSKETNAFEACDELAETGCTDMTSIDLIAM